MSGLEMGLSSKENCLIRWLHFAHSYIYMYVNLFTNIAWNISRLRPMEKMSIPCSSSWRSLCPPPAMTRRAWCPTLSSWSGARSRGRTSPGTLRSSSSAPTVRPSRDIPGRIYQIRVIYSDLRQINQELSDSRHCCGYRKVCVKNALPGAWEKTNNEEDETNDTAFGNNYKQTLLTFFQKLISVLLFHLFMFQINVQSKFGKLILDFPVNSCSTLFIITNSKKISSLFWIFTCFRCGAEQIEK